MDLCILAPTVTKNMYKIYFRKCKQKRNSPIIYSSKGGKKADSSLPTSVNQLFITFYMSLCVDQELGDGVKWGKNEISSLSLKGKSLQEGLWVTLASQRSCPAIDFPLWEDLTPRQCLYCWFKQGCKALLLYGGQLAMWDSTSMLLTWGLPQTGPCVLVSAGIELIFFLLAGAVQCFGFSTRIMLVTRSSLVVYAYPKSKPF